MLGMDHYTTLLWTFIMIIYAWREKGGSHIEKEMICGLK